MAPPSTGGYETHIEEIGTMLLAGIALGLALPALPPVATSSPPCWRSARPSCFWRCSRRRFDGWIARLVMDWFGVSAGLLIIKGLFRSWSAMYDKHLEPWGGTAEAADEPDEDYDLPAAR